MRAETRACEARVSIVRAERCALKACHGVIFGLSTVLPVSTSCPPAHNRRRHGTAVYVQLKDRGTAMRRLHRSCNHATEGELTRLTQVHETTSLLRGPSSEKLGLSRSAEASPLRVWSIASSAGLQVSPCTAVHVLADSPIELC
jgi:hypothetical protein